MKIEGAIFDVDGTLLDSLSIWDSVGEKYLLSLGIQPEENLTETIQDMSLTQSAQYFQNTYGVEKSVEEIIEGINGIVRDFYLEKVQLLPGVKEFLDYLSLQKVKMVVATVSDKYLIEKALIRCEIRNFFSEILTCEEVGAGKDEPLIYEKALEELGTSKENTIIFEDAPYALETAEKAGFQTRQAGGTTLCRLIKIMQENGGEL